MGSILGPPILGVSQLEVLFSGPSYKDYSISGFILGSPVLGSHLPQAIRVSRAGYPVRHRHREAGHSELATFYWAWQFVGYKRYKGIYS